MSENVNRVATVGSPSSNYEITLDVTALGRETPLVGSVVAVENPMGEGSELALGTVTEVTTTNKWHEDPTFRGLVRSTGEIAGMSGDDGDVRQATIRVQAAWRRANPEDPWKPSGPNFRMSPATGTPVVQITEELVRSITDGSTDIAYLGHLAGTDNITLPFSIPDFASSLGAMHAGVYGLSGSGKALHIETPILTREGWKTLETITTEDYVYNNEGNLVPVTYAHDILHNRECYKIIFSDGSTVIADGDHLWGVYVKTWAQFTSSKEDYDTPPLPPYVTGEQFAQHYRIPSTHPQLQSVLNDVGHSYKILNDTKTRSFKAVMSSGPKVECVVSILEPYSNDFYETRELQKTLRQQDENYFVMTTRGLARTINVNSYLLPDTTTPDSCGGEHLTRRTIVSVEPTESVPVRCLTVGDERSLYVVGENFIPTHNTAFTSYLLAAQMRWEEHGIVIIDPQGQWSSEHELPFSVQGFAAELGRDVVVRRISEDLKLDKDAPLMANLLKHTELVKELGLKHESTEEIVWYEITKALKARDDWTSDDSESLLKELLEYLADPVTAGRIYTTPDNAARFQQKVQDILDTPVSFKNALYQFQPIHNLFQETNPSGGVRHDLSLTLLSVFDRSFGKSAPLVVLDMSSKPLPGMDEVVEEAAEKAYEVLEKDVVKAAVLRNMFRSLKRASEERFRDGMNLNTLIVLDEAWRYAAPPGKVEEEEIATLSKDLAGYARDTRKFGIGWLYISQSTRSVNLDVWDQMSIRIFGYGLNGSDLDKMAEVIDDRTMLRLYRGSGNPRSTGVYPFMITGPVSPLAANSTPVMLHVYTDFEAFRNDNKHWIAPIREKLGLPVMTGQPTPVNGRKQAGKPKQRGQVKNVRKAIIETNKAARENRTTVGMSDPEGFADPLSNLDDEVPF